MFAPGPGWALLKAIGRAALKVTGAEPIIDVFADLMDFGKEVHEECRKDGIDQQMKQVLEDLAHLRFSLESERESLRVMVGEIAVDRSERDQVDLAMMLSAVPARVRQSLKRPADQSGLTASPRQVEQFQQERGIGQLLPTRPPLHHPGDRLKANPDWELVELLGVGGFGEVWKAHNDVMEEVRAIKFCTDPQAAKLLRHEASLVGRVRREARDPGVVRLENTYFSVDPPCLDYEYVDGIELGAWFQGSREDGKELSAAQVTKLVLRLVEIIATVHALPDPIVHRDLKPANILMQYDRARKSVRPRITDFGIGGVIGTLAARNATVASKKNAGLYQTEAVRGAYSPLYSSPEQIAGEERDPRDDVHALGMIWYQMTMGNLSLNRPSGTRWLSALRSRGLSTEMVDLLANCLEEAEHRIPNAVELRDRLRPLVADTHQVRSVEKTPPLSPSPTGTPSPSPVSPVIVPAASFLREGTTAGEEMTNSLGLKLCWCPPGQFTMGSPSSELGRNDDENQAEVTLTRGFWLGKFQVTQADYQAIMTTNRSHFQQVAGQQTDRFPVETVLWLEAMEFCRLLTERECQAGRLSPDWRYNLPTEAQWEYACRAGSKAATSFGDGLSSAQANFDGKNPYNGAPKGPYLARPEEVGNYPANLWGLHDMHGNVWEWCQDTFESPLPGGDDPSGRDDPFIHPDATARRVCRGGAWISDGHLCRSACRVACEPLYRRHFLGLRIAAVRRVNA